MATELLEDGDLDFSPGCDANTSPDKLPPGRYCRSENMVCRGGVLQCRPGYRCIVALPTGRLQGMFLFKPKVGGEVFVFAVSGMVYRSEFPFTSVTRVANISFSSSARKLFFEQVEQSIQLNFDGSLSFVTPKNFLIIQDGGQTPAAVFDGSVAEHQRGVGKIPLGGPMRWVGDRLWVGRDTLLFASDISNPTSFTESTYIATVDAFVMPAAITALARTPTSDLELAQLLVYTEDSTSLIQAGIRDRALWPVTPDMQRDIFPDIGCKSDESITQQNGFLWWYSKSGLISLDAALMSKHTSRLPFRDLEMMDSKSRVSPDLGGVALGGFENYLLISVPYAGIYNRHTWVMDQTPRETLNEDSAPAWNGVWTGTRPSQWLTTEVRGQHRVFYISPDFDGINRLWEAFVPDRLDEKTPISWWFDSRAYVGDPKYRLRKKSFKFADLFLTEMAGDVDVAVFWAGSDRGKYKKIFQKRFKATRGCFRPGIQITMQDKIFAFKKQSRYVRTQDGKELSVKETDSSCGVESDNEEFFDESFQVLVAGSGPCAVRGLKVYLEVPRPQDILENPGSCADETDENIVRFDGAAADSHNEADAWRELETVPTEFVSTRTISVTSGGLTEIGVATGRSIISQEDADKIAEIAAIRRASHQLEDLLPRIVSIGQAANESLE